MKKPIKRRIRSIAPAVIIFCTLMSLCCVGIGALTPGYWITAAGMALLGTTLILTED